MAIGTPTSITSTPLGSGSSGTSYNLSTTAAVTAGNRAFAVVGWLSTSGTPATVTTSGGSLTWAQEKAQTGVEGSGNYGLAAWSADAPSGMASSTTLNFLFSSTVIVVNAVAFQCSGIATSSPADGSGIGQFRAAPTTSWSSTAMSTANADDLLIGAALADNSGSGRTSTATGSFTELFDFESASAIGLTVTYRVVAATASYTATGTWSTSPEFADIALMAAYKADTGGAATTVKQLAALGVG